jgi:hypothetical protein
MQTIRVCITFDVDFTDYRSRLTFNDFEIALGLLLPVFERHPDWRFTWFIRLDAHIETLFGYADHIFKQYEAQISELQEAGHEIGWHLHCYTRSQGDWKQNTDVRNVMDELTRYAPLAQSYRTRAVRMGWGFHTNETMRLLTHLGFEVDSSAIPRPRYQWEESQKDWTLTPVTPYYPSEMDYRVPGEPALPILEIPLSVVHVQAPYDTGHVVRYLNPAYHPVLLRKPLEKWLTQHSHLVTVTHPYELHGGQSHGLLAFDVKAFEQNMMMIEEVGRGCDSTICFLTISEFANQVRNANATPS